MTVRLGTEPQEPGRPGATGKTAVDRRRHSRPEPCRHGIGFTSDSPEARGAGDAGDATETPRSWTAGSCPARRRATGLRRAVRSWIRAAPWF